MTFTPLMSCIQTKPYLGKEQTVYLRRKDTVDGLICASQTRKERKGGSLTNLNRKIDNSLDEARR